MRLDIFADPICPWCFIGKRHLEAALAQVPRPDLEVRWRAFQLNPVMPPEGMDRQAYIAAKFGPRGPEVYEHIREAGLAAGIDFAFDRIRRTPNSVDAHRLTRYAARHGLEDRVVDALFRAYFLEGRDIGDREVLAAVAAETGLDADEARAFLEGDQEREAVLAEDAMARYELSIAGVPCFILDGRQMIPGAVPPEVFHRLFDLTGPGTST